MNHQVEMILPDGLSDCNAQKPPPIPSSAGTPRAVRNAKLYSGWCLRPSQIAICNRIGSLQNTTSSSSIKLRKGRKLTLK